jgi:hypothetical protein
MYSNIGLIPQLHTGQCLILLHLITILAENDEGEILWGIIYNYHSRTKEQKSSPHFFHRISL